MIPTTSTTSERSCLTLPAASNRAATGSSTKLIGVRPEPIMLTAATPNATMPATRISAEWATRIPGIAKSSRETNSPGVRGTPNRVSSRSLSLIPLKLMGSVARARPDTTVHPIPIASRTHSTDPCTSTIAPSGSNPMLIAIRTLAAWIRLRPRR